MIRLQKLLAQAGLGSRRAVEEWIRQGRVTVGGNVAQVGDRAGPGDDIRLDGRKVELAAAPVPSELLLYYKPLGEVTTRRDPQKRPTVFERLPAPQGGRWIAVGRLDVNTAGLLLFTTDGVLAHRLMHPSLEVEREYLVEVRGLPGPEIVQRLLQGVPLEDGPARLDSIVPAMVPMGPGRGTGRRSAGHAVFRVVLHEGRNREVRRLWKAVGFEVSSLLRIRYGPIELPRGMRPGSARTVDRKRVEALVAGAHRKAAGLHRPRAGKDARPR